jgi:hypothetical protein
LRIGQEKAPAVFSMGLFCQSFAGNRKGSIQRCKAITLTPPNLPLSGEASRIVEVGVGSFPVKGTWGSLMRPPWGRCDIFLEDENRIFFNDVM